MREPKDIKIGDYTLEEILERHKHWLNRDCENWESMRADLHNVDLHDANMSDANMRGANMMGANMRGANMRSVDLSYANMMGANIHSANMPNADLHDANMSYANMRYTDLYDANMSYTDLHGSDMRSANMMGANMCGANMNGTIMNYANMKGANMKGANMRGADISVTDRLRKGIKLNEPIIGWKKCKNDILVKLEIPRGAIIFSINNSKCRTDKAKVLEIIGSNRAYSKHKFFSYYVGDVIEIFDFNCEYNIECAKGIHFFKTREEAENY